MWDLLIAVMVSVFYKRFGLEKITWETCKKQVPFSLCVEGNFGIMQLRENELC